MSNKQVTKGQQVTPIGFEILLSLAQGPQHGYGIKLDIEERTGGELSLGSGTLYQAIQRLERGDLIAEAVMTGEVQDGRRGRSYELRPAGRDALGVELRRLSRVLDYARSHQLLTDVEASP